MANESRDSGSTEPRSSDDSSPHERSTAAASGTGGAAGGVSGSGRRGGRAAVLVPALTFVVGLLLGIAVLAAIRSNGSGSTGTGANPSPTVSSSPNGSSGTETPTTSPSPSASILMTIPQACLKVADQAQDVLDTVNQAAQAARDLKATRLSDLVRKLDRQQSRLRATTAACRSSQVTAP